MKIEDRIVYLEGRHRELDQLIKRQTKDRQSQAIIDRHKREKLLLKDEIKSLRNQITA